MPLMELKTCQSLRRVTCTVCLEESLWQANEESRWGEKGGCAVHSWGSCYSALQLKLFEFHKCQTSLLYLDVVYQWIEADYSRQSKNFEINCLSFNNHITYNNFIIINP